MTNKVNPKLCGGIFFALLLAARPQRTNQNEHLKGDTDSLSDTSVIMNLCKVVKPDYKAPSNSKWDSFETTISKYKSCIIGYSNYIPITTSNESRVFNEKIIGNYQSALKLMCNFVGIYIDNGVESDAAEQLIIHLLELVSLDEAFDGKLLYVCADGIPKYKEEVLKLEVIEVQPFLLGMLHFISQYCIDNKVGKETFNTYWKDGPFEKKFVGDFGSGFKFDGRIEMLDPKMVEVKQPGSANKEARSKIAEVIDAEIVDDYQEPEQAINTSFTKNSVTFNVNMVQTGNNNTQVAYAENAYSSWNNSSKGNRKG